MKKYIIPTLAAAAALGVAALPLGGVFAASTTSPAGDTTIQVTVGSTIAISVTSANVTATMTPNQKLAAPLSNTLRVTTNNLKGYSLSVAEKKDSTAGADNTGALVSTDNTDKIPALAGSLTAGTAGWNLSCKSVAPAVAANATGACEASTSNVAVSTTATTLVKNENGNKMPVDDTITINYDVATGAAQLEGKYQDTITYTASTL